MIMELEKRTMGSVDTSRTALAALAFAREVGKESSPGCAIWFGNSGTVNRMEPEGFKREPCYGEMLEWSLGGMQNPIRLLGGMQNSSWLKERLDVVAGVWEACERPSGASVAMGALRLGSTDAGSG